MHTIALNVSQMHTNRKERMGDFTWRVSDCEELVGVTHREKTCVSVVVPSHSLTPSSSTLGIEKQLNYFNTFHRLPQLRKSSVGLI